MKTDTIILYVTWGIAVFFVCTLFIWLAWNGFVAPEFHMPVMSYPSACGATVLWWMGFFSVVGCKELGNP
jgi:hypothetical protein